MPNPLLSKYSARIKDIYVELKGYQFFHSPYYEGDNRFIGRERAKERIKSILENTEIRSGAYLITGFRGMGKTSVIREAIRSYNEKYERNDIEDEIWWKSQKQLTFVKRSIGYTLGFLCAFFLLTESKESYGQLVVFSIFLFFYFVFFWMINKKEEISNSFWKYPVILYVSAIFYLAVSNLCSLLIILLFALYGLFLLLNYVTLNSISRISNSAWIFYKLLFVLCLVAGLGLFFYSPSVFCGEGMFNCFEVNNAIITKLYGESSETFSLVFRIIFGLFFSYCIISIIVFVIDLSKQIHAISSNKSEKRKREIESKKYYSFEINLSQESLNEIDILRRMTLSLEDYWVKNRYKLNKPLFDRKIYFFWRFILLGINPSNRPISENYESVLDKLVNLRKRMSGQVTSRKELNLNPNITTGISNGLTRIAMPLGVYSNKDEIAYPIANAKEVEDELISILKDIDVIRDKNEWTLPQFAFIIDELDKIEPNSNISIQEKESTNPSLDYSISARDSSRFRQRQEAVASLLANLKGFLNVVRAKFFFIGGREMFDADLADIADRDSFYSSIFNDVIYIESFFKDSTGESGAGGVTQMTENYLCNIILYNLKSVIKTSDNKSNKKNLIALYEKLGIDKNGEFSQKSNYISLLFDAKGNGEYGSKDYSEKVEESNAQKELRSKLNLSYDELKQQAYKVIFTLQNYVIYLNYRSNGTPKKLTALTEQLMRKGPSLANNSNFKFLRDNVVVLHDRNEDPLTTDLSNKLFLKFGFNTQYEIGLTANLYRPYIIANSRHLKSLGDKLLFSSSFIIDHLLKFHSFGFSWRNLELIPEVVLVNREPNLRKFIEDLMRFYSMTYVRDTVSGIFEHRFRSIIRKELIYLSKTSDLSSAAFNFTLDESLSTKRHYKKKLIELREKYHEFSPTTGDNQFVHSLCFLQTILGNLHFYDKEYDEAILYYSESIQSLRLPNAIGGRFITRHQFLLWVRNQLKLGLTLEKIRAFNSAFSLYRTLILDTERYLKMVVSKTAGRLEESEDHRTIQLISMPFVAFLAATEKARNDGITYANLYRNREEFIKTITPLPEHIYVNLKKVDHYRRNFLLADYYNNVGSILFYKNCQYSNFFSERKDEDSKIWWLDSFEEFDGENLIAEQQRKIYDKSTPIREYDFFPSLTPFNYYWNSLYFLVEYHRERIIAVIEEESEIETLINDIATIIGVVNNELIGNRYDSIPLSQNLLALGTGYLLPECVDMISSNRFYYLANVISKIGDSILAGLRRENFIIPKLEFNARDLIDTTKYGDKKRRQNINKFREIVGVSLYQAETVLYIYKLAAALYKRAGQTSFYAFQLKKILYVIKDLIEINKNDKNLGQNLNAFLGASDTDMQFKKIEEIAEVIFKATTWNNEVSNRPQILKYREILGIEKRSRDRELIYHNINNITDNREVVLLVEGIKMKLSICNFKNYLENFIISKSIITSYGSMNNRYLRMLELKYRSERCYFIVKDFLGAKELLREQVWKGEVWTKNTKSFKERMNLFIAKRSLKNLIQAGKDESVSVNDLITFIIREALFCLRELIKMIKLYDPGYVIGYTFIAEAHNRMGDWCHAYDNYKYILTHAINDEGDPKLLECFKKYVNNTLSKTEKVEFADELGKRNISEQYCKEIKEKLNDFQTEIKEILGPESLAYLESKNHYESAIQYYYKVIQMHSDGKAYRDKLHSIYMLEDDYNDNAAHYIIASERLRINTGNIKNKIRQLSKKTEGSKLYDYSSYLSSNKDENPIPNMNTIEKFLKFFEFEI